MAANWREAIGLGLAGGMRASAPLAALALRGRLGSGRGRRALVAFGVIELIYDKHPRAPSRTDPPGVIARATTAAITGRGAGGPSGAAAGAVAAMVSMLGCSRVRGPLGRRFGVPDPVIGAAEDALMIAIAYTATSPRA